MGFRCIVRIASIQNNAEVHNLSKCAASAPQSPSVPPPSPPRRCWHTSAAWRAFVRPRIKRSLHERAQICANSGRVRGPAGG